ncbi:hypothetical protein HH219_18215 [Pseudoalteromonas sp. NEC-BIFX-2020_015]|uniref:hypothetical protein n=1 Tax=Pseudoalteromonas sp. NEC-BIFX-2020_015 TaxID=2729544 RepID=UPI0014615AB3|nr:hypothetical protein [Pseudoalteromonas sp. NEC-BIFX-2020_015]NMR27447.1 hypothetical protein [Pseudoalteromonas sp. NEC-BIFX-2020_015]
MKELKDVYPGEAALNLDKVRKYKQMYISGSDFPSPELVCIGNYYVVRDGNHRVCAWAECFKSNSQIKPISFVLSKAEKPTETAEKQFMAFAQYYGQGIGGFQKIPQIPESVYYEEHGKMMHKINIWKDN